MMFVTISINADKPLVHRGVRNMSETNDKGETKYMTDCGKVLWHKREDGPIKLAIKVLKKIKRL